MLPGSGVTGLPILDGRWINREPEPSFVLVSAQTSTGSSNARSMISMPRFPNLATLASVPASTIVFVITLCAWRLYKGTIILRDDDVLVVETDEKEDVDAAASE